MQDLIETTRNILLNERIRNDYEQKITITLKGVESLGIAEMLKDIQKTSETGHSFDVIVDPDENGGRKYGIDGDGAFRICDLKVE